MAYMRLFYCFPAPISVSCVLLCTLHGSLHFVRCCLRNAKTARPAPDPWLPISAVPTCPQNPFPPQVLECFAVISLTRGSTPSFKPATSFRCPGFSVDSASRRQKRLASSWWLLVPGPLAHGCVQSKPQSHTCVLCTGAAGLAGEKQG